MEESDNEFGAYLDYYDTMEINSWDVKMSTSLNTRLIQLLEIQGVPFEFFVEHCVEHELETLRRLAEGGSQEWNSLLRDRNAKMLAGELMDNGKDSRSVFKMSAANVGAFDPEFCRRRLRLIERMFSGLRGEFINWKRDDIVLFSYQTAAFFHYSCR